MYGGTIFYLRRREGQKFKVIEFQANLNYLRLESFKIKCLLSKILKLIDLLTTSRKPSTAACLLTPQAGQGRPHSSSFPGGLWESPERPSAAGSAGSAAGQVLLFEPVARWGAVRNPHLGGRTAGCAWDHRPEAAASGLSSPHPTLPLQYFSMTGARGHFRLGGGVPLARGFISSFRPRPGRCSACITMLGRAAAGTHCAKGAEDLCRRSERRRGPAG